MARCEGAGAPLGGDDDAREMRRFLVRGVGARWGSAIGFASLVACATASPLPSEPDPPPSLRDAPAPADAPVPIIAVQPLEDPAAKFSTPEIDQLSSFFAAKLTSSGAFRVVPPSQLQSELRRQKAESFDLCYDESCQIALAKAVAASKSLRTRIIVAGTRCAVTSILYDLEKETSERAATQKVRCDQDALVEALDAVASELATGKHVELAENKVGSDKDRVQAALVNEPPDSPSRHLGFASVGCWAAGLGGVIAGVVLAVQARAHADHANDPEYVGAQLEIGRARTSETFAGVAFAAGAASVMSGFIVWLTSGE